VAEFARLRTNRVVILALGRFPIRLLTQAVLSKLENVCGQIPLPKGEGGPRQRAG